MFGELIGVNGEQKYSFKILFLVHSPEQAKLFQTDLLYLSKTVPS